MIICGQPATERGSLETSYLEVFVRLGDIVSGLSSGKRRLTTVAVAIVILGLADPWSLAFAQSVDEQAYAATSEEGRLWWALLTGLLIVAVLVIGLVWAYAKEDESQERSVFLAWYNQMRERYAVSGLAKRAPELKSVFRR